MNSQKKVRQLLDAAGLKPNKKLGQNFLVDEGYLQKIARLSMDEAALPVLEIGAGLGALTREIASLGSPLTAVEIDRGLYSHLQQNLTEFPDVKLILGDILQLDVSELFGGQPYQVVANIPYYLTSKLIRHLLESNPPPSRIHLLVQKEVAQRACEDAPQMNLLALSIRLFGDAKKLFEIPAGAFYPAPKVDSAILRITPSDSPTMSAEQSDQLMVLARAAFQQKRKTLLNSLASLPNWSKDELAEKLSRAGIDSSARPQHLDMDMWLLLFAALS